jgi:hypothetical protein
MSRSDTLYSEQVDNDLKRWQLRKEVFEKGLKVLLLLNMSAQQMNNNNFLFQI